MNKKHAVAAGLILALLAGVGWALFSGEDQAVIEAKQQRNELFEKIDTLSPEQRRAEFDALRESAQNLSEDQRRELRRGGRQFMMQRVDRLLAMSAAERNQELDRMIDRMEERRQNRDAGDGGPRGDRGGDMSPAERDQRRKQRLDRTSPQMRAKMDQMKDLMNQRREERGLEPLPGGGPPRGKFGGGPGGRGGGLR
ncbi:MAG: hypothetical protein ACR2NM_04455 [Bythopirellula sp.]